jgi:poly(3-hydroxybutyrate) depolymerase
MPRVRSEKLTRDFVPSRSRVSARGLWMLLACVLFGLSFWPTTRGNAESRVQTARFSIHGPSGDRESAIAVWPAGRAKEPWPFVIAFHGMGESRAGRDKGYRAWVERYNLVEAYQAMLAGPLTSKNFGGLVRDAELARLNAEFTAQPFKGVFVVGVYTPDLLAEVDHPERIDAFAKWVAQKLVPKVRDTFPIADSGDRKVGVDGVSLGGMVALEVGLRYPDVFGSVGTMQPAIRGREEHMADLAKKAAEKAPQAIRLLSSDKDPLLPVTKAFSQALRKRFVAHTLVVTPGGHDYAFNQGPGAIELLYFHDRALHQAPAAAPVKP